MSIVAEIEGVAQGILHHFEAAGHSVVTFVLTETQKAVALLKTDSGLVGVITNALTDLEDSTKTGAERFEEVLQLAVPEVIKVATAGASAFAVVETEVFDLGRELVQSIYNDVKGTPASSVIAALTGAPLPVQATPEPAPATEQTPEPPATGAEPPAAAAETHGDGA